MRRNVSIGIGIIAIIIIAVAYFVFILPPPIFPSETFLKRGAIQSDWTIKTNETTITGSVIWTKFAYYSNESIRIYKSIYWGALLFTKDGMSWFDNQGNLQEKALTLSNLTERWQYNDKTVETSQQNGSSTFKFAVDNHYLRVVFSVPCANGNDYKYKSLEEAWESGELYLTLAQW